MSILINNSNNNLVDLNQQVLEKIQFGENLISSTVIYEKLEGLQKLQRKIKQELKFLKRIYKNQGIKQEHLQCSNLTHFSALIDTLKTVRNCLSVNKVFLLDERKVTIDIVCDNGLTWMKVIARNPKAINQICMGDASYGVRSVIDQAEEYVQCSKLYPCFFQIPKIIFVFVNGIADKLASTIESLGIVVEDNRLKYDDDCNDLLSDEDVSIIIKDDDINNLSTLNAGHINKVNFDVSAMLAYVSSVTNGSADLYQFSVRVLAQQAEWEKLRPQKIIIDNFIKDKNLYCCQTAMDNFINIVNTVGGPSEQIRAKNLIERLTVLPDNALNTAEDNNEIFNNNIQLKSLKVGGKIKERSLIVFKFGDRIQAVTITANDGFVRAARQQGVNFVVFIHESRALTEQKESTRGSISSVVAVDDEV